MYLTTYQRTLHIYYYLPTVLYMYLTTYQTFSGNNLVIIMIDILRQHHYLAISKRIYYICQPDKNDHLDNYFHYNVLPRVVVDKYCNSI